jgi:hypothetical protein
MSHDPHDGLPLAAPSGERRKSGSAGCCGTLAGYTESMCSARRGFGENNGVHGESNGTWLERSSNVAVTRGVVQPSLSPVRMRKRAATRCNREWRGCVPDGAVCFHPVANTTSRTERIKGASREHHEGIRGAKRRGLSLSSASVRVEIDRLWKFRLFVQEPHQGSRCADYILAFVRCCLPSHRSCVAWRLRGYHHGYHPRSSGDTSVLSR